MSDDLKDLWLPGETARFEYGFDPDDKDSDIAARLGHRTGQVVTVVEEGTHDGDRIAYPTLDDRLEAGVPAVYEVKFPDGHLDTAFEDELFVIQ